MLTSNGALEWSVMVIVLRLRRRRQNIRVLAKLGLRTLFIAKVEIKTNQQIKITAQTVI